jgi:tRNA (cytidine/uridine-2'-O-)-methyltransferase
VVRPLASVHVALIEPEIHWNTGNAGRTCLALGAKLHLIEPLGFSLEAKEVKRAGLDYWERVDPSVWPSLETFERALPELGEPILFSPDGRHEFWELAYPERAVLIFGRESVGLPPELRARHAERTVRMPMADPGVRSLNLSTTVGIALYEVLRQREVIRASPPRS